MSMNFNGKTLHTICYLISKSLDEKITPEESEFMNKLIISDDQARRYYVELMQVHYNLRCIHEQQQAQKIEEECSQWDVQLWQELASYEMTAETIEQEPAAQDKQDICSRGQIVKARAEKPSKFSIYTLAASIAAMVLMVLYIHFMPTRKTVVATVKDSFNCKWSGDQVIKTGDQILNEPMVLLKGFVTFTFDYGAEVVVEGPAEFTPTAPDKMMLNRGKAFAHVPKNAIGFTIDTPYSSVVDLGTEFGVTAENNGTTEIHVYDGKVNLIAATSKQSKDSQIVTESQARRIDADNVAIEPTGFKEYLYAQQISSQDRRVIYGRPISLSSLVAGGDGFSSGSVESGIDPSTGQINEKAKEGYGRSGSGAFSPVADKYYIDGVFVPSGSSVVTSEGHRFTGFPETANTFWSDITANPVFNFSAFDDAGKLIYELQLVGTLDGEVENLTADSANPMIIMHPNVGITFDLQAIRQAYPEAEIDRFMARCGITKNTIKKMKHEYWVLIDGRNVYHHWQGDDDDTVGEIDISILPNQRFLTLAVTDGGDNTSFDWCLFDNAIIELVPKGLK